MKRLLIHPLAEAELNDAVNYYEACASELGLEFLEEIEDAFDAILAMPSTWASAEAPCRRFMLARFPYAVIYRDGKAAIEILAISHSRRRPKYWTVRTRN